MFTDIDHLANLKLSLQYYVDVAAVVALVTHDIAALEHLLLQTFMNSVDNLTW